MLMVLNDPLSNAFAQLKLCETLGRNECTVKPASKLALKIFDILQQHHYIGSFEVLETGRGNKIKINLLGRINKCGAIKPRFSIGKEGFVKFEKRYLPARGFGILVVSTSQGVLTHEDALKKGIGGKLLAYCY